MAETEKRYCIAKYLPSESKADCDATIETLKHLASQHPRLNRSFAVKRIRSKCSEPSYSKKHSVTVRTSALEETTKREAYEASPEGKARAKELQAVIEFVKRRDPGADAAHRSFLQKYGPKPW